MKKKQELPKGLTHEKIKKIIAHYDNQTEEERLAEIETWLNDENITMVAVPTDRVREVVDLLGRKPKRKKKLKQSA